MSNFKEYVSLVATILVDNEQCVILGRQAAKFEPGFLKPPGGGVEMTDLTLWGAAIREFGEETGLEMDDIYEGPTQFRKLYSRCHEDCIVHVYGLRGNKNYSHREALTLLANRHVDAKCPDELTEVVAVPVDELYSNPRVRREIGPTFLKELSCCDPHEALGRFFYPEY